MDNISFHKNMIAKERIEDTKNETIYIPPYSPEYNPIEKIFYLLKNKIRKINGTINKKIIETKIE